MSIKITQCWLLVSPRTWTAVSWVKVLCLFDFSCVITFIPRLIKYMPSSVIKAIKHKNVKHYKLPLKYIKCIAVTSAPKDALVWLYSHIIKYQINFALTTNTLSGYWIYSANIHNPPQPRSTLSMVNVSVLLSGSKLCHIQWLPWDTGLEETGNQFASRYVQPSITAV